MANTDRIGFGGGCHWCTEAVFRHLLGVARVDQGFVASTPPDNSLSEAVIVEFDADAIGLEVLIEVHLRTHAATSNHTMRGKYRSAVYTFDTRQTTAAQTILNAVQTGFDAPLVTRILPFVKFKASDQRFQNYQANNPGRPFCQTHIDPKLALIRREFAAYSLPGAKPSTKLTTFSSGISQGFSRTAPSAK
jgi:peptide-methionine (S)-S-oxide reductase